MKLCRRRPGHAHDVNAGGADGGGVFRMVGTVERALGVDIASERWSDDVVEMVENGLQLDAPWVVRIIGC
jgi:hypothetical protein